MRKNKELLQFETITSRKLTVSLIKITAIIYFLTFLSLSALDFLLVNSFSNGVPFAVRIWLSFKQSLILIGPALFLSVCMVLLSTWPIIVMMRKSERDEPITEREREKSEKRMHSLTGSIYISNLVFALIYFGLVSDITVLENIMVMFTDVCLFFLGATVLSVSYQQLLVKPKTMMKIYSVDKLSKQWFLSNVQDLFLLISLILTFAVMFNSTGYMLRELSGETGLSIRIFSDASGDASPLEDSSAGVSRNVTSDSITFMYIKVMLFLLIVISLSHFAIESSKRTQAQILQKLLRDLTGGEADLTRRVLIVQGDDMGHISSELNALLDYLQTMFQQIRRESAEVMEATLALGEVMATSLMIAGSSKDTLDRIERVSEDSSAVMTGSSEVMDEMFKSLNRIYENVQVQLSSVEQTSSTMVQAEASIRNVSNITRETFRLTESLKALTDDGKESVVNSMNAVKDVEESVDAVNSLVTDISKIMAQTNILAMNAAIEAAHAGAVGRGFAVVAQEVRNLADNSAEKLREISLNMRNVLDKVNNGVALSVSANDSLLKIDDTTKKTVQLMNEVDSAMEEQTTAAKEVLQSVRALAESTKNIHDLTATQQDQNLDVKASLGKTAEAFTNIKNASDGMVASNREMLSSIGELERVIQKNKETVAGMDSLVSGYKI